MIRALAITTALTGLLLSTGVYAQTTTTTTDTTTTTTKTTKHHHHKAMNSNSTAAEDMAATKPHAPGAQERALDAGQEPATKPDPQGDAEVRKLNGGM